MTDAHVPRVRSACRNWHAVITVNVCERTRSIFKGSQLLLCAALCVIMGLMKNAVILRRCDAQEGTYCTSEEALAPSHFKDDVTLGGKCNYMCSELLQYITHACTRRDNMLFIYSPVIPTVLFFFFRVVSWGISANAWLLKSVRCREK